MHVSSPYIWEVKVRMHCLSLWLHDVDSAALVGAAGTEMECFVGVVRTMHTKEFFALRTLGRFPEAS